MSHASPHLASCHKLLFHKHPWMILLGIFVRIQLSSLMTSQVTRRPLRSHISSLHGDKVIILSLSFLLGPFPLGAFSPRSFHVCLTLGPLDVARESCAPYIHVSHANHVSLSQPTSINTYCPFASSMAFQPHNLSISFCVTYPKSPPTQFAHTIHLCTSSQVHRRPYLCITPKHTNITPHFYFFITCTNLDIGGCCVGEIPSCLLNIFYLIGPSKNVSIDFVGTFGRPIWGTFGETHLGHPCSHQCSILLLPRIVGWASSYQSPPVVPCSSFSPSPADYCWGSRHINSIDVSLQQEEIKFLTWYI